MMAHSDRVRDGILAIWEILGTGPSLVLAAAALYAAYVVKCALGIDIFPHWGLHATPRLLAARARKVLRARAPARARRDAAAQRR